MPFPCSKALVCDPFRVGFDRTVCYTGVAGDGQYTFCAPQRVQWLIDRQGLPMKTLQEIEQAIETLPLPDQLRLYKDLPQLIGRDAETLDWQRQGLERFFQDDTPDDSVYDHV